MDRDAREKAIAELSEAWLREFSGPRDNVVTKEMVVAYMRKIREGVEVPVAIDAGDLSFEDGAIVWRSRVKVLQTTSVDDEGGNDGR
jgi:hypothetical protein